MKKKLQRIIPIKLKKLMKNNLFKKSKEDDNIQNII